ncbi:hypothetical protein [Entomobacter blattae]|uniref:Uncharacterized protein n=1 Tax=Entomobacter blattae TaxID=2762277 RepID=A0A7H1NTQ1_9PROT|nr:hypothetical protein [Entomobacter blattae]QNT79161.1 hypothetical protein JGUZn3_19490 [Entomobacter blattae]
MRELSVVELDIVSGGLSSATSLQDSLEGASNFSSLGVFAGVAEGWATGGYVKSIFGLGTLIARIGGAVIGGTTGFIVGSALGFIFGQSNSAGFQQQVRNALGTGVFG